MKTEYLTDTPYYTEADLANLKPPEATHEPILINDRVDSVSKHLQKVQRKWKNLASQHFKKTQLIALFSPFLAPSGRRLLLLRRILLLR